MLPFRLGGTWPGYWLSIAVPLILQSLHLLSPFEMQRRAGRDERRQLACLVYLTCICFSLFRSDERGVMNIANSPELLSKHLGETGGKVRIVWNVLQQS